MGENAGVSPGDGGEVVTDTDTDADWDVYMRCSICNSNMPMR